MANVVTITAEQRRCCCGCMTVGQGSITIGILNIISSIIGIILESVVAHRLIKSPGNAVPQPGGGTLNKSYVLTMVFIRIFMMLVYLLVSAMMVQGCRTRQHSLMRPWLIWNYICLSLVALGTLINVLVLAVHGLLFAGLILIIFAAIVIAISAYLVRVVFYHVEELKGRSQPTF